MNGYRTRIVFDLYPEEQGGLASALPVPVRSLFLEPVEPRVLAGTPYDSIASLIFVEGVSWVEPGSVAVDGIADFIAGDEVRSLLGPGSRVRIRTVSRVVGDGVVGEEVVESGGPATR